jgi:hypothetical protein
MTWTSRVRNDISKAETSYKGMGLTAGFFSFFQGRSTFFGILFAITGVVFSSVGVWGFIHGRDLTSFGSFVMAVAALNGSIQAMMFAHSTKEDWAEIQHRQLDIQQQQVSVTVNNATSSAPTQVSSAAPTQVTPEGQ